MDEVEEVEEVEGEADEEDDQDDEDEEDEDIADRVIGSVVGVVMTMGARPPGTPQKRE